MSLSRAALSVVACEGGTLADFDALPRNDPAGRRPQRRPTTPSDFDAVYAEWFEGVLRWAAAMGVRNSDKYDVAQNVFLVVMRRLHDFDRRNMAGWLYTITARQVKDYQMQLWNRRIFRTAEPIPEELPSRRAHARHVAWRTASGASCCGGCWAASATPCATRSFCSTCMGSRARRSR